MIERGTGIAIWKQIAADLQAGIADGQPRSGERLPTEMELAERYQVNRHTVRRAIAELANDGYVEATRGRGTFVSRKPIAYPLTARTRFSEIVSAQDLQPGGRLISSAIEPAAGVTAQKLTISEAMPLIRMELLRVAGGRPLIISTAWVPVHMAPNLIADYAETGSITKALERAGFADYRRKASWISTSPADAADLSYLQLAPGVPVLVVESLNVTGPGVPLQYSRARFAGDAVQLVVES